MPFWVLGLSTDSSTKVIRNRIEQIRQQIFFGTAPQGVDEHALQAANFELEDSVRRFQSELQWLLWNDASDSVATLSTIAGPRRRAIFLVPESRSRASRDKQFSSNTILCSCGRNHLRTPLPLLPHIAGVYLRWCKALSSPGFQEAIYQRALARNDLDWHRKLSALCLDGLREFATKQSFHHVAHLDLNVNLQLLGAIQSSSQCDVSLSPIRSL